jgi:hypothetical protein
MWVSMTLEPPVSRTGPEMLLLFEPLGFTIFLKIEARDGISPRCQTIQPTQSPGTAPKAFESAHGLHGVGFIKEVNARLFQSAAEGPVSPSL